MKADGAMHTISKTTLAQFWKIHQEAESKLLAFYRALENCTARDFTELKKTFSTADYVPKKFTVIDVGGNVYRVVVVIHYNTQKVFIRGVFTHAGYDKWTKRNREK
jgi:mRNA interferase HigB